MTSPSNYLALTQQLSTSQRGINWFSCGLAPYAKILLTVSLAERQLAGKDEILHQPDLTHSTQENASLLIANYKRWAKPIAKTRVSGPPFSLWLHYSWTRESALVGFPIRPGQMEDLESVAIQVGGEDWMLEGTRGRSPGVWPRAIT